MVYAAHGLGRIVAVERRRAGTAGEADVVVVELSEGLTVSLPRKLAEVQLRAPMTPEELQHVRNVLEEEPVANDKTWLSRRNDAIGKLTSGNAVELAEVVRDGAARARARSTGGSNVSERDVFLKARRLLSNEVSHVLGVSQVEADAWIDEQLGQ